MPEGEQIDPVVIVLAGFVDEGAQLLLQVVDAAPPVRGVGLLHRGTDVEAEDEVIALVQFQIVAVAHDSPFFGVSVSSVKSPRTSSRENSPSNSRFAKKKTVQSTRR